LASQKRRERYRSEFRAEILAASRELIREEGYEGLTLRKLGQRMECSPMALYSYFADKQALLTALALEGFEALAKKLEGTVRREPLPALRKMLLDYVNYAEQNPIEYRILFLSAEPHEELTKTRHNIGDVNRAFGLLLNCVRACIEAGVHGAAAILITMQNFPFGSRKRYVEEVVATILIGAQTRAIERI
jgi:AcrR family transcriptional regulator